MINHEIAEIFSNMASYYEMSDDKNAFFRARAYKKAAETLEKFPYDLKSKEWNSKEKLVKIDGIGQTTAEQITEYIEKGKIQAYEDLKKESPVNLEELLKVQGIGPKTIKKLYKELTITDVDSLKSAAEAGLIAQLDGFGEKSQEKILESIEYTIINKDRILYADAEIIARQVLDYLKKDKNLIKAEPLGSFRRKKDTIGDIDILILSKDPKSTTEYFNNYDQIEKILATGDTKSSVWLKSKIQIDIRIVDKDSFGSAMQYFTGSKEHNIKVRNVAISNGYKLSEYGLFDRNTKAKIAGSDEKGIYNKLGLDFIEPELREAEGEIEASQKHLLPKLVKLSDLSGDLHMHTTFSDGINSIEEMVVEAIKLEHKYIGISDHFGKLRVANAIDSESEFYEYINEIRRVDKKYKEIRVLASAEVEIDKEGNLDFDPKLLEQLDYIVASIHFSTNMPKKEMTKRIITALRNPLTTILGHPTNRLLLKRKGYEFDQEKVFKVALSENVALEINSQPLRLDLNDKMARMAKDIGCKIAINTDSHNISSLNYLKYGINTARRGWIEPKDLFIPKNLL